jgi:hypothetical protein
MKMFADRCLPFPRILHPWPEKRFLVTIQGGSPPAMAIAGAELAISPLRLGDNGSRSAESEKAPH